MSSSTSEPRKMNISAFHVPILNAAKPPPIDENDLDGFNTCDTCDADTCVTCMELWHPGISCKLNDRRQKARIQKEAEADEKKDPSIKLEVETSKICPVFGCAFSIKKIDGCGHMRCNFAKKV